ncbi:Uncharacterized protein ToN1_35930 [Aromatoleum petrolei]|nr:Uncharacterized protein ToN1_35930 [Aromatoleum petrolei]
MHYYSCEIRCGFDLTQMSASLSVSMAALVFLYHRRPDEHHTS